MAPILIDGRDLKKLTFVAGFFIVFIFIGGFLLGYQLAMFDNDSRNESEISLWPEQSINLDKDVKQQVAVVHVAEKVDNKTETKPVEIVTNTKRAVTTTELIVEKKVDSEVKVKASVVKKTTLPSVISNTLGDNSKINFSIQVAVYGGLSNAEVMMESLQVKKLDAYVSDYINKKNKVRFNVRFGYFKDKKTALKALKNYIDVHKGDGYLVNYSADNIVSLPRQSTVSKKPVKKYANSKPTMKIKQIDSHSVPATTTKTVPDNISQQGM